MYCTKLKDVVEFLGTQCKCGGLEIYVISDLGLLSVAL